RALDRIARRFAETRELEGALKALSRAVAVAQRLFDLRAQLRWVFGEPAQLLQHLQALGPHFPLEEHFGERTKKRAGLAALFGLAKRFGDSQKGLDVARIALQLTHPERFECVEFFVVNQRIRVIGEAHEAAYSNRWGQVYPLGLTPSARKTLQNL